MFRKLTLLLAALLCFVGLQGQIDVRFGPGAGLGIWGLGTTEEFTDSYQSYQDQTSLGKSVVFGLSGRWLFGKHLQLLHELDYQTTTILQRGSTLYGYATPYPSATIYDGRIRLHQLVMPICLGVAVGGKQVRASLNFGARFGYVFAGTREFHSEYTQWSGTTPMPDPVDTKEALLKGSPGDRFILQGMGSLQLEILERVALSFNVAVGPANRAYSNGVFDPPRTMAYAALSFWPFGKRLKEAPTESVQLQGATRFETGPEIGTAFPLSGHQMESTNTSYSSTTVNQSSRFMPAFGWKFRFGTGNHTFVDLGLQAQFVGMKYDLHTVYPGLNTSHYEESGTVNVMKLCLPVAVGYRWEMGKFQPFASLGFRANHLASRNWTYSYNQYYENNAGPSYSDQNERNDFDGTSGKRWLPQGMASIGTGFGKHWTASLCYAAGPGDAMVASTFQRPRLNQDLFLTVGWRFAKGS